MFVSTLWTVFVVKEQKQFPFELLDKTEINFLLVNIWMYMFEVLNVFDSLKNIYARTNKLNGFQIPTLMIQELRQVQVFLERPEFFKSQQYTLGDGLFPK